MPYTNSGVDEVSVQSFMAAVRIGLKSRFGGKVDHLRIVMQEEKGREGSASVEPTVHNASRFTFEENSGLATIIPVDYVNERVKSRAEAIWKSLQPLTPPAPLVNPEVSRRWQSR